MPATIPEHKIEVRMGDRRLELGGPYIGEMRSSNDLLGNREVLRARMAEDGYLLIRGLHDAEAVLKARRAFLERLQEAGRLDPSAPMMDGVIKEGERGSTGPMNGLPAFLDVVNAPRLMDFFSWYLGGPAMTYDFKWMRAIGCGDFTGAHCDVVYMGRGTKNVFTTWTPFGHIGLDMGPLAVCHRSHCLESFAKVRGTYGKMDVDRDNVAGWFSKDPVEIVERFGGRWLTTAFAPGDALIFGMFTMHASLTNISNRFRLTSDTRYQLASEPADERWIGKKPIAHTVKGDKPFTSMEQARASWGL